MLEKHVQKIIDAIKSEKNFTIYNIVPAEIVEEEEMFSSFIEVTLTAKDFSTLILFLFYYGPTSIEVIKPDKLEITQSEFQDGLVQLSGIFQKYADFMLKHLNKEELNKFHKDLYN